MRRNNGPPASALVPQYAAVCKDVLLTKSGAYQANIAFVGPDISMLTADRQEVFTSCINEGYRLFGSGYMVECNLIRVPVAQYPDRGAFPDNTPALCDDIRREQFLRQGAQFESRQVITITYQPQYQKTRKMSEVFLNEALGADTELAIFRDKLDAYEGAVRPVLTTHRLTTDETLSFLKFCITCKLQPVKTPLVPYDLDVILADQDVYGGFKPRVGDMHIRVVSVVGFPLYSNPIILDTLKTLPFPYRVHVRFKTLDRELAVSHLERHRAKWRGKQYKFHQRMIQQGTGETPLTEDEHAMEMVAQLTESIREVNSLEACYGYATFTILTYSLDADEAELNAHEVIKTLQDAGFSSRMERENAFEGVVGSWVGNGSYNLRGPLTSSVNTANLAPFSSYYCGELANTSKYMPADSPPTLIALGQGNSPVSVHLHIDDVAHTLVVGPTGGGKSVLVLHLAYNFLRHEDAQVFLIDKDYSAAVATRAAGGAHYDLDEPGTMQLCPFQDIGKGTEEEQELELAWALESLELLLELHGVHITPEQRRELHLAIQRLAACESKSITQLVTLLQDKHLKEALSYNTLSGPMGRLLDGEEETLQHIPFQTFELASLINSNDKNLVAFLTFLFHAIERRLNGRPSLLIIDEGWMVSTNRTFEERFYQWLATLRKKNTGVVLILQSLSQLKKLKSPQLILESCPTKFYLPNSAATNLDIAEMYQDVGFNSREIENLARATPKRHYYYTTPNGRRMVDLALDPVTLSFIGAAGQQALRESIELEKTHGDIWPAKWLERKGLTDGAKQWLGLYNRTAKQEAA